MKSKAFIAGIVIALFLATGLVISGVLYLARVEGEDNAHFTVILVSVGGVEYDGTCTYKSDILMAPDRSTTVSIEGAFDMAQKPIQYDLDARAIRCEIINETPELPLWLELRRDGEQVGVAMSEPPNNTVSIQYPAE